MNKNTIQFTDTIPYPQRGYHDERGRHIRRGAKLSLSELGAGQVSAIPRDKDYIVVGSTDESCLPTIQDFLEKRGGTSFRKRKL